MFNKRSGGQPSQQRNTQKPPGDDNSGQIKQHLASALDAQEELAKSLAKVSLRADVVGKIKVDDGKPTAELKKVSQELKEHKEQHGKEIKGVMDMVHGRLKQKVVNDRDDFISEHVKTAIARQVAEQVETQIGGILPVPLNEQLEDAKQRLDKLKKALANSEARRGNVGLDLKDWGDWREPLKVVLLEDGNASKLYPPDLAKLWDYKEQDMKDLLTSFGLQVDSTQDSRRVNFNRFIHFIGVRESADEYIELARQNL